MGSMNAEVHERAKGLAVSAASHACSHDMLSSAGAHLPISRVARLAADADVQWTEDGQGSLACADGETDAFRVELISRARSVLTWTRSSQAQSLPRSLIDTRASQAA